MATRTLTIYQNDSAGKMELLKAYAGDNFTEAEENSILMESNLDSFENTLETVPKLFSQGSHLIKARIDQRSIDIVATFFSETDNTNPVHGFNMIFRNPDPAFRLSVKYENNDLVHAPNYKEYDECYISNYEIRKVGMYPEVAYELTLSLLSLDGK